MQLEMRGMYSKSDGAISSYQTQSPLNTVNSGYSERRMY